MENIINKIKKLMNIANDPKASENEVFIAVKNAHKLMAKHNIKQKDIEENTQSDVITETLDVCPNFIMPVLLTIANEFRCKALYISRRNRFIPKIYGLNQDVEIVTEVFEKVKTYINKELPIYVKDYKKKQGFNLENVLSGYIPCDARIIKKSYCQGFASQLQKYFDENKIELKEEFGKYELISLGVPKVVDEYINNVVKPRTVSRDTSSNISTKAYGDGKVACDKYHGK